MYAQKSPWETPSKNRFQLYIYTSKLGLIGSFSPQRFGPNKRIPKRRDNRRRTKMFVKRTFFLRLGRNHSEMKDVPRSCLLILKRKIKFIEDWKSNIERKLQMRWCEPCLAALVWCCVLYVLLAEAPRMIIILSSLLIFFWVFNSE